MAPEPRNTRSTSAIAQRYLRLPHCGRLWPEHVVNTVGEITDTRPLTRPVIHDDYEETRWPTTGPVVGHVQSGKDGKLPGVITGRQQMQDARLSHPGDRGFTTTHPRSQIPVARRTWQGFVGRDSDQILSRSTNVERVGHGDQPRVYCHRVYQPCAWTSAAQKAQKAWGNSPSKQMPSLSSLVITKNTSIPQQCH